LHPLNATKREKSAQKNFAGAKLLAVAEKNLYSYFVQLKLND